MSYPPQGPYPPQQPSGPPHNQPQSWPPQQPYQDPYTQAEQQKAGLFKAGKWGIWILIGLIGVPAVLCILTFLFCCGGGAMLPFLPVPDPSVSP